ncbi:hypothetical protein Tco_0509059 [Tanacetum coccineum]
MCDSTLTYSSSDLGRVMRKHGYGYLREIESTKSDNDLYTFKEGDFLRLRINDIKDMLLLIVQNRLTNLSGDRWRNRLMRSDELYKFSDRTLTELRTSLDDITKNICSTCHKEDGVHWKIKEVVIGTMGAREYIGDTFGYHAKDLDVICFGKFTDNSDHFEERSWSIHLRDPYKEADLSSYWTRHHVLQNESLQHHHLSSSNPITDTYHCYPVPIPLPPSTSRRADILEADTPPRKRLLLTAPRPGCEVGESSAAAARQPGPTMACRVDFSSVDTVETRKDRVAVRAEIEVLRRERLACEQESMDTRQALARSEAYSRELEARVTVLETQARRHEWLRQDAA